MMYKIESQFKTDRNNICIMFALFRVTIHNN